MRMAILALMAAAALPAQTDYIAQAVTALQQGNTEAAEKQLQICLESSPRNVEALSVLAVVFDQERKYDRAEDTYKRALAAGANDPSLLNNYGNHLLTLGHADTARQMFLRSVRLDPANRNANVQLAKLAIDKEAGAEALTYLGHLSAQDRTGPDMDLLFGIALSSTGRYPEAEQHFRTAAATRPEDFEIQYDLGLAASKANHLPAAEEALKHALDLRPSDPSVVYDLAAVEMKQSKDIDAIALLAKAPPRPETERLLAEATQRQGYFADSIKAWDRYLRERPADETARRERAFTASAVGQDPQAAFETLTTYAKAHPGDAIGHYELGTALSANEPDRATQELSRAILLNPRLTAAYMARGLLAYRRGDNASSQIDFKAASELEPNNARILDRLAEAYTANGHPDLALPILERAARIAPGDSAVLLHLGRALTRAGQKAEAETVFARYRQAGNSANTSHESGLVEFLSLPPGEQQARYRAGVERTVAAQPQNVEAQLKLLEILLQSGEKERAGKVSETLLDLKPTEQQFAEAGQALLDAEQYHNAEDFLKKSMAKAGPVASLQLELAQARFYTASPQAALAEMERIDRGARTQSFYSARTEMLQKLGSAASQQ